MSSIVKPEILSSGSCPGNNESGKAFFKILCTRGKHKVDRGYLEAAVVRERVVVQAEGVQYMQEGIYYMKIKNQIKNGTYKVRWGMGDIERDKQIGS